MKQSFLFQILIIHDVVDLSESRHKVFLFTVYIQPPTKGKTFFVLNQRLQRRLYERVYFSYFPY